MSHFDELLLCCWTFVLRGSFLILLDQFCLYFVSGWYIQHAHKHERAHMYQMIQSSSTLLVEFVGEMIWSRNLLFFWIATSFKVMTL